MILVYFTFMQFNPRVKVMKLLKCRKEAVMRRALFSLMVVPVLLVWGVAQAYDSGHTYINGRVTSVSGGTIAIDDYIYRIDPKCRVVIVFKQDNSFHERPARLSEVGRGDTVTAKKIANTLYEIMIERWRR